MIFAAFRMGRHAARLPGQSSQMCGFVARLFLSEIISNFFHMCYLRMRQDNALLHAAMMARADTVIVC